MIIKGDDYNFGRVVYLTIGRNVLDVRTGTRALGNNTTPDTVTIVFDPKTNPQWNTRIDFWVKHVGQDSSSAANSFFALANIDLYNIGPALQQFMNAYNNHQNKGYWPTDEIVKYSCSLSVGYHGGKRTRIFAGIISSWYVERLQNESTVDNVWHLYAQYPTVDVKELPEEQKAVSGTDYAEQAKQDLAQTFISGEEYLKAAIMAYPRETYAYVAVEEEPVAESFVLNGQMSTIKNQTDLVALPASRVITSSDFDKFFQIKYQHFRTGEEYPEVKQMWQKREAMESWEMDYSNLMSALSQIAEKKNCHASIQLDENTGMQTVYIYPAGRPAYKKNTKADFTIVDFQNLRRPPGVSGSHLQLDLLLEPSAKPGDIFMLTLSKDFAKKYKDKLSFDVNYSGASQNATTMFAGANFTGLTAMIDDAEKGAMAQTGNIFGTKYSATFIIHQGSTHSAQWSTQVDCTGVVLNSGEIK